MHSIQYKKLTSSRKRSVARFIHRHLPSGNMMFEYKHRCPFCTFTYTPNTDHDHYLTCAFTRDAKNKRLSSLFLKLEKLHTPPFLRDNIINTIDKYYNNGLVDDIPASCSTSYKKRSITLLTFNNASVLCTSFEGGSQPLSIIESIPIIIPIISANDLIFHSGFNLLYPSFGIFIIMRGSVIATASTHPIKPYVL